jgi:1-phosphofructokinase
MRVLTLTANLLAETTYTFDAWKAGATQRARAEFFQVGGKGINVTRMLARLGVDSVAACFPGGATGARCEAWLRENAVAHRAFRTTGETRSGAVVRAPGRAETTFLGTENCVDAAAIAACAAWLGEQPPGDLLAVCGSIPAWNDARWDPLRTILQRRAACGTLVVDTYGPPLAWLAALPVRLVKINRREFAGLADVAPESTTDENMPELLARVAAGSAPARWIVSDGPNPVWFCERGLPARSLTPPRVVEISPTGSGDVLLAAVLFALERRGASLEEALRFALPLAAANAASPGVADFDLTPFGFPGRP